MLQPALFRVALFASCALLIAVPSSSDDGAPSSRPVVQRPVHTYSIVARDPETGQMGVAVQSHWFSVGSIVSWAEAGVGAVATQSLVDVTYGPLALEMMRAGRSPEKTLEALKKADEAPDVRQVGIVDAEGRVAAHTGDHCIPMAGHRVGDGYTVQANLMEKDTVWDAMARAYESSQGDLADRMIAALEAAQAEKGDIRGMQSASILIVAAEATGRPWEDRIMDLRVEDHPDPVNELKRLVMVHRAYDHMNAGDLAMEHGDTEAAKREYGAAEALIPENVEMVYWHAIALANAGEFDASLPLFKRVFERDANWAILTPRLVSVNLLNVTDNQLRQIVSQAP
jgi:uncharacterized Ntn-hydrolase superfamily protein